MSAQNSLSYSSTTPNPKSFPSDLDQDEAQKWEKDDLINGTKPKKSDSDTAIQCEQNQKKAKGFCPELLDFKNWDLKSVLWIIIVGFVGGIIFFGVILVIKTSPYPRHENQPRLKTNQTGTDDDAEYYKASLNRNKKFLSIVEDIVHVHSHLDLHGIVRSDQTVKVKSLQTRTKPSGIQFGQGIKYLELLGPISQPWLHYLIGSLNSIETILIDVDLVCSGFDNDFRSNETEESIVVLPNLEKLKLENSNNCPILQWGFGIATPNLKTVEVTKASLTKPYYDIFSGLLNKTSDTIEGIEISHSYICFECDITELQFDNLKYLKISKRVDQAPFGRN